MPTLPTIEEENKLSWLRLMWRYRRQFQAISAASLVCIAGGLKLAWCIYEPPSRAFLTSNTDTHCLMMAWFVGIVCGAIAAPACVYRLSKNVTHSLSGLLLVVGGLLSVSFPTLYGGLLTSCLLEGLAYGLNQVQLFCTGGEVAFKDIRGFLLSSERVFLWLGVCLQLIGSRAWYAFDHATDYNDDIRGLYIDQLHGATIAILGFLSLMAAFLYRYETPVWLQRNKGSDDAVVYTIKRLMGARYTTPEVQHMRDDCKQLLAARHQNPNVNPDWMPLLKVAVLRCFVALSLSLPFNRTFLTVSWTGFASDFNCMYLLGVCGLAGSLVGGALIDDQGRRKMSVLSLLLTGIFIFILGGIFEHVHTTNTRITSLDLGMAATLMLLYLFFTAAGVSVASSVYMAEAFTVPHKVYCISGIVAVEHMLDLLLVVITVFGRVNQEAFYLAMGSMSLLLGVLGFLFMPETKYLSLHECLLKFQKVPF